MGHVFTHQAVLQEEVLEGLQIKENGCYLDATFGRGGHARLLFDRLGPQGRLIAFDQDPEAVAVARQRFADQARFQIIHGNFAEMQSLLQSEAISSQFDGIMMDLGVSSPQLDDASRGFSFLQPGPLDMRMNPEQGESAAEWLARAETDEIADVLWGYGEERFSRKIARAIVMDRQQTPFIETTQLAELIGRILPKREKHKHPATRTFQAIRIFINRELDVLQSGLDATLPLLAVGGRLAVISFHSLEDRIVKRFIRDNARPPQAERQPGLRRGLPLPLKQAAFEPLLKPVGKAIFPSAEETQQNPRARSAVLRIAERL